MTNEPQHIERTREKIACDFLKDQGIQHFERNYRYRIGKIDIVAVHWEYIVFYEVKTCRNMTGLPTFLSLNAK